MEHITSYYSATARDRDGFPTLREDLDVDVAIIGGGFTGVASAVELAERGLRVALCEAHRIGWGATGRNGGQITGSLSGDVAMDREFSRTLGEDAAQYVWDLRWRGHDIITKRVSRYGIACDLAYGHIQTALRPSHMRALEAVYHTGCANGMGDMLELLDARKIRDYLGTELYVGGLLNRKNMHVHALDLCVGEARAAQSLGAHVFEQSPVHAIERGARLTLRTPQGSIRADKVILAGNAYHLLEQKSLKGKLFPASLENMATEPLGPALAAQINPQNLAVYDSRFVLDYYRLTADHRLMFGGGTNYSGRDHRDIAAALRPALERTFPQLKGIGIEFSWSGHDGIILNRIPQVGCLDERIFYIQGYSGHGIALSHIMAQITADAIMGDSFEFRVFEHVKHWHLPVGRGLGGALIAIGMAYYRARDALG